MNQRDLSLQLEQQVRFAETLGTGSRMRCLCFLQKDGMGSIMTLCLADVGEQGTNIHILSDTAI